jgi:hypothetical protein
VFGLVQTATVNRPDLRAIFLSGDSFEVEVVEERDPVRRRERVGDGRTATIEHLALEVDDLDALVTELEARGVALAGPIEETERYRSVWSMPSTTGGVRYQFVQARSR